MRKLFALSFLLITLFSCKAQLPPGEYTSKNKKAIASFEAALKYFNARNDSKAIEELLTAIGKDPLFIEPHMLLAEIYSESNKVQLAIDEYAKALQINPKYDKKTYFLLANEEISIGKYEEAKKDYETYLKYQNLHPDWKEMAEHQLANCNFAIAAIKNPLPFCLVCSMMSSHI